MLKVDVELRGFKELAEQLEKARKEAFPYAMKDAVNEAAFVARRIWGEQIRRTFTTRNTWTAGRALEVDKARSLGGRGVEATLGSTARFMALQERGGTVRGRSGHLPIPGPVAAGQPPGMHRTRLVRASNRLGAIKAAKARRIATRKRRNAAAMAIARRAGKRFAVLERPAGGVGLFAVSGSKRKMKARLVWDLSRRSARVPPHPTLGPTLKIIEPRLPGMYANALAKQLRRWHVLGY